MRKVKFYLSALLAVMLLVSCGSDEPVVVNTNDSIYKIVLEASGEDYTANVHIVSSDNVSILDATSNVEKNPVNEYFKGKKTYITSDKVQYISVQGVIISDVDATLKMFVYRDGEEIYNETVSVPDLNNTTGSLFYTNINN